MSPKRTNRPKALGRYRNGAPPLPLAVSDLLGEEFCERRTWNFFDI